MSLDSVLSQLRGVRKTGPDKGVACCTGPLHKAGDKHASLSWRELSDGTVLLHCFAGCNTHEILSAVGLEMHDLYPDKPASGMYNHHKTVRRAFTASDALLCLSFEALFLAAAANMLASGEPLTESDRARLWKCAGTIAQAQEYTNA